jgi:hypothetical protein
VRHVPEWLPWFSYKQLGRLGYNIGQQAVLEPMEFVMESMVNALADRFGICKGS